MNRDGDGAGKKLSGETIYVTHNKCPLHGDEQHRKPVLLSQAGTP